MNIHSAVLKAAPLALASVLVLAACSSNPNAGKTFSRGETQQARTVEAGVVQSVRVVTIERRNRPITGSSQGLEVTVLLDNGQTVAVVQQGPLDAFRAGDLVNVTSDGSTTRVSRR